MGADNDEARPDEYPKHKIEISSFGWMKRKLLMLSLKNL